MVGVVAAAAAAFMATNIDDLLILMLMLAGGGGRRAALGHGLGMAVLVLVSLLGAWGLHAVSGEWLRLLGLLPVALGVRAWFSRDEESGAEPRATLLGVALITIANGADNIGVYVPLFAGLGAAELAVTALVFAVMCALWSLLAGRLAGMPVLRGVIERNRRLAVTAVLVGLGLYILIL